MRNASSNGSFCLHPSSSSFHIALCLTYLTPAAMAVESLTCIFLHIWQGRTSFRHALHPDYELLENRLLLTCDYTVATIDRTARSS